MKYTVFVTVTMSVEVDSKEIKKEFGNVKLKTILDVAKNKATLNDAFDTEAKIFEVYDNAPVRKVKRGIGSY
jgi:hypothetical protein